MDGQYNSGTPVNCPNCPIRVTAYTEAFAFHSLKSIQKSCKRRPHATCISLKTNQIESLTQSPVFSIIASVRPEEIMENTIQNICKTCGQPILLGEPVKVTWNDEQDEHIVCPAPNGFVLPDFETARRNRIRALHAALDRLGER